LKKRKKVLIILVCILAFIAIAGCVAYNFIMSYAGDKAMDMLVTNQLEGMLSSGEITLEELEEIVASPEAVGATEPAPSKNEDAPAVLPEPSEEKKPVSPTEKPKTQKETVKAASQKITDSISREEKDAMMKLISSRLTKADIQYLAGLAAGGLDGEEISKAYKLAKSRFTAEELVQVKTYWHRYKANVLKPKKPQEEKR